MRDAACYIRVSTDDQADSVQLQRAKTRAYCDLHGLRVAAVFTDVGKTGASLKRAGAYQLRELVLKRRIDCVVVYKLDRLTRSVQDLGKLLEEFEAAEVSLHAVAESLDTSSAAGRLVVNVMASVAQWEREVISERTKQALAYKKALGVKLGSPPRVFDAAVVARVHELRDAGHSLEHIAGVLTFEAPGEAWYDHKVRRVLTNHPQPRGFAGLGMPQS